MFALCGLCIQCVSSFVKFSRDLKWILLELMLVNKAEAKPLSSKTEHHNCSISGLHRDPSRGHVRKESVWHRLYSNWQALRVVWWEGHTDRCVWCRWGVCVCVFNPAAFFTGSRRTHMWLQRAPHPSRAAEEASHTYTHNHTPLVCCCCGYVWQDEDSSRPSIHHPMSFQHVTYTHRKHLTHILGRSTISLLQLIKAVM